MSAKRAICLVTSAVGLSLLAGCGGSTTTIIQTVATTTTTQPSTTTAPPPTTSTESGGGFQRIRGITDGPVHVPITPAGYYADMRAWPAYSYETKVELAGLYLQNNPHDCHGVTEIAAYDAPYQTARAVERWLDQGQTGGMQIAEVFARFCSTPSAE